MHHPAMAIECGLYSSKQIGAYNLEEFRALVSQKALYMTVQDNTGGMITYGTIVFAICNSIFA